MLLLLLVQPPLVVGDVLGEAILAHGQRVRAHRGTPWLEWQGGGSGSAYLAAVNESFSTARETQKTLRVNRTLSLPAKTRAWPASLEVRGNFFLTARFKLRHDAEQLRYLVESGKVPDDFLALANALDRAAAPLASDYNQMHALSAWTYASLWSAHNALLYLPPKAATARSCLSSTFLKRAAAVEDEFLKHDAVVVDECLSSDALEGLYEWCLSATVFWDVKPGYLGAYVDDGFWPEWLLELVRELRASMPRVVGDLELSNAWVYKYDDRGRIDVHADAATVNVNVWLTPDDAIEEGGGLIVHRTRKGTGGDWNGIESVDRMRAHLRNESRGEYNKRTGALVVPYERNRCVIFDSALLHETQPFRQKPGYRNRRINLTLLFGPPDTTRVCAAGRCRTLRLTARNRELVRAANLAPCVDEHESIELCVAYAIRKDDPRAAMDVLATARDMCGSSAWKVCGTLATLAQEELAVDRLPAVLGWYRHSYYHRDPNLCPLVEAELARWRRKPTALVHVPRTAGTSTRQLYALLLDDPPLAQSRHFTASQLAWCEPSLPKTIAIVRSPFGRAASAFRHLTSISTTSPFASDKFFGTWLGGFADFAHLAESGGLALAATLVPHFFPMLDYIVDVRTGDKLVDTVVRFEDIFFRSKDPMRTLLRVTRLDTFVNRTNALAFVNPPLSRHHHCPVFTRNASLAVAAVYDDDIRAFGYAFDCAPEQLRRDLPAARDARVPSFTEPHEVRDARRRAAAAFAASRENRASLLSRAKPPKLRRFQQPPNIIFRLDGLPPDSK